MGCQLRTETQKINYSRGAWLVVEMCSPWFDRERDTDSDGYHQDRIDESSVKSAAEELPDTLAQYLAWRIGKGMPTRTNCDWTQEDYQVAVQFVRTAAQWSEWVFVSY